MACFLRSGELTFLDLLLLTGEDTEARESIACCCFLLAVLLVIFGTFKVFDFFGMNHLGVFY